MAIEVGEIYIKVRADLSSFNRDIQGLERRSLKPLAVKVDDRPLTALNKHLDLKADHVRRLQREWDANPLTIRTRLIEERSISSSQSSEGRSRAGQSASTRSNQPAQANIVIDRQTIKDLGEEIQSSFKTAAKDANKGGLIGGLLKAPLAIVSRVVEGAVFRVGEELAVDFAKGLNDAVKGQVAPLIGSFELVAEKFVDSIALGIKKVVGLGTFDLKLDLSKNPLKIPFLLDKPVSLPISIDKKIDIGGSIQKAIGKALGEQEVLAESAIKRRNRKRKTADRIAEGQSALADEVDSLDTKALAAERQKLFVDSKKELLALQEAGKKKIEDTKKTLKFDQVRSLLRKAEASFELSKQQIEAYSTGITQLEQTATRLIEDIEVLGKFGDDDAVAEAQKELDKTLSGIIKLKQGRKSVTVIAKDSQQSIASLSTTLTGIEGELEKIAKEDDEKIQRFLDRLEKDREAFLKKLKPIESLDIVGKRPTQRSLSRQLAQKQSQVTSGQAFISDAQARITSLQETAKVRVNQIQAFGTTKASISAGESAIAAEKARLKNELETISLQAEADKESPDKKVRQNAEKRKAASRKKLAEKSPLKVLEGQLKTDQEFLATNFEGFDPEKAQDEIKAILAEVSKLQGQIKKAEGIVKKAGKEIPFIQKQFGSSILTEQTIAETKKSLAETRGKIAVASQAFKLASKAGDRDLAQIIADKLITLKEAETVFSERLQNKGAKDDVAPLKNVSLESAIGKQRAPTATASGKFDRRKDLAKDILSELVPQRSNEISEANRQKIEYKKVADQLNRIKQVEGLLAAAKTRLEELNQPIKDIESSREEIKALQENLEKLGSTSDLEAQRTKALDAGNVELLNQIQSKIGERLDTETLLGAAINKLRKAKSAAEAPTETSSRIAAIADKLAKLPKDSALQFNLNAALRSGDTKQVEAIEQQIRSKRQLRILLEKNKEKLAGAISSRLEASSLKNKIAELEKKLAAFPAKDGVAKIVADSENALKARISTITKLNTDIAAAEKLYKEASKRFAKGEAIARSNKDEVTLSQQTTSTVAGGKRSPSRTSGIELVDRIAEETFAASGISPSEASIPKVRIDSSGKIDKAAYDAKKNEIIVTKKFAETLISGTAALEDMQTVIHELRHAVQFDFGQSDRKTAAQQEGLLTPTSEEAIQFAGRIERSAKQSKMSKADVALSRKLEQDAYVFASRNLQSISEAVKKGALKAAFEDEVGFAGGGAKDALIKSAIDTVKAVKTTGATSEIDVSEAQASAIKRIKEEAEALDDLVAEAANLEVLPTDAIQDLLSRFRAQIEISQQAMNAELENFEQFVANKPIQAKEQLAEGIKGFGRRDLISLASAAGADPEEARKLSTKRLRREIVQADIGTTYQPFLDISRKRAQEQFAREERRRSAVATAGSLARRGVDGGIAIAGSVQQAGRLAVSGVQKAQDAIDSVGRVFGAIAGTDTGQALIGATQNTVRALGASTKAAYQMAEGLESVALAVLPFGTAAKGIARNVALPAAAFGVAQAALPPGVGTMIGEGANALSGAAINPLLGAVTDGITSWASSQSGWLATQVAGQLSEVATMAINAISGPLVEGVAAIAGGKVLTGAAEQIVKNVVDSAASAGADTQIKALPPSKPLALPAPKQRELETVEVLALPPAPRSSGSDRAIERQRADQRIEQTRKRNEAVAKTRAEAAKPQQTEQAPIKPSSVFGLSKNPAEVLEAAKKLIAQAGKAKETAKDFAGASPVSAARSLQDQVTAISNAIAEVREALEAIPASERTTGIGAKLASAKGSLTKQFVAAKRELEKQSAQRIDLSLDTDGISREVSALGSAFSAQLIGKDGKGKGFDISKLGIAKAVKAEAAQAKAALDALQKDLGGKKAPEPVRKALRAARTQITGAEKKADQLIAEAERLGVDIGEGHSEGLSKAVNRFNSVAGNFAKGGVETIKDVWEIASPSKVGIRLGGFFGEGLAIGILDSLKSIPNKIKSAIESITNPAKVTLKKEASSLKASSEAVSSLVKPVSFGQERIPRKAPDKISAIALNNDRVRLPKGDATARGLQRINDELDISGFEGPERQFIRLEQRSRSRIRRRNRTSEAAARERQARVEKAAEQQARLDKAASETEAEEARLINQIENLPDSLGSAAPANRLSQIEKSVELQRAIDLAVTEEERANAILAKKIEEGLGEPISPAALNRLNEIEQSVDLQRAIDLAVTEQERATAVLAQQIEQGLGGPVKPQPIQRKERKLSFKKTDKIVKARSKNAFNIFSNALQRSRRSLAELETLAEQVDAGEDDEQALNAFRELEIAAKTKKAVEEGVKTISQALLKGAPGRTNKITQRLSRRFDRSAQDGITSVKVKALERKVNLETDLKVRQLERSIAKEQGTFDLLELEPDVIGPGKAADKTAKLEARVNQETDSNRRKPLVLRRSVIPKAQAQKSLAKLEKEIDDQEIARKAVLGDTPSPSTDANQAEGFVSRLRSQISKLAELKTPIGKLGDVFGSLKDRLKSIAIGTGLVLGGQQAIQILRNVSTAALDAALQFDSFKTTVDFASGGMAQGAKAIEFVSSTAKNLGIPLRSAREGYVQLASSTRNTPIEGQATKDIFTGLSQAATVLNLSEDQVSRAFLAVSQSASKGKVQAEELRGQLGEAIPGAFGIAARAIGKTEAELNKMLELGQVIASDFLPKFGIQLQKEFGDAAANASGNAQSAIFNFQNALLKTQESLGKKLQPFQITGLEAAAKGLEFIEKNFNLIAIALGAVAIRAASFLPALPLIGKTLAIAADQAKTAFTALKSEFSLAKQDDALFSFYQRVESTKDQFNRLRTTGVGAAQSIADRVRDFRLPTLADTRAGAINLSVKGKEAIAATRTQLTGLATSIASINKADVGVAISRGLGVAAVAANGAGIALSKVGLVLKGLLIQAAPIAAIAAGFALFNLAIERFKPSETEQEWEAFARAGEKRIARLDEAFGRVVNRPKELSDNLSAFAPKTDDKGGDRFARLGSSVELLDPRKSRGLGDFLGNAGKYLLGAGVNVVTSPFTGVSTEDIAKRQRLERQQQSGQALSRRDQRFLESDRGLLSSEREIKRESKRLQDRLLASSRVTIADATNNTKTRDDIRAVDQIDRQIESRRRVLQVKRAQPSQKPEDIKAEEKAIADLEERRKEAAVRIVAIEDNLQAELSEAKAIAANRQTKIKEKLDKGEDGDRNFKQLVADKKIADEQIKLIEETQAKFRALRDELKTPVVTVTDLLVTFEKINTTLEESSKLIDRTFNREINAINEGALTSRFESRDSAQSTSLEISKREEKRVRDQQEAIKKAQQETEKLLGSQGARDILSTITTTQGNSIGLDSSSTELDNARSRLKDSDAAQKDIIDEIKAYKERNGQLISLDKDLIDSRAKVLEAEASLFQKNLSDEVSQREARNQQLLDAETRRIKARGTLLLDSEEQVQVNLAKAQQGNTGRQIESTRAELEAVREGFAQRKLSADEFAAKEQELTTRLSQLKTQAEENYGAVVEANRRKVIAGLEEQNAKAKASLQLAQTQRGNQITRLQQSGEVTQEQAGVLRAEADQTGAQGRIKQIEKEIAQTKKLEGDRVISRKEANQRLMSLNQELADATGQAINAEIQKTQQLIAVASQRLEQRKTELQLAQTNRDNAIARRELGALQTTRPRDIRGDELRFGAQKIDSQITNTEEQKKAVQQAIADIDKVGAKDSETKQRRAQLVQELATLEGGLIEQLKQKEQNRRDQELNRIERNGEAAKNALEKEAQSLERVKNLLGVRNEAIALQQRLLSSRGSLAVARQSAVTTDTELAIDSVAAQAAKANERGDKASEIAALKERAALEAQLTKDRVAARELEQELARRQLELEIKRDAIAARINEKEKEIAVVKAKQAQVEAQIALSKALQSGDSQQIEAAQLGVQAANEGVELANESLSLARENTAVTAEEAANKRETLDIEQAIADKRDDAANRTREGAAKDALRKAGGNAGSIQQTRVNGREVSSDEYLRDRQRLPQRQLSAKVDLDKGSDRINELANRDPEAIQKNLTKVSESLTKTFERLESGIEAIAGNIIQISDRLNSIPPIAARFTGGPLAAGQLSTIAERGPELVKFAGGGTQLFSTPQLVQFGQAAMVYNAADTRRMLSTPAAIAPLPSITVPRAMPVPTSAQSGQELAALRAIAAELKAARSEPRTVQFNYPQGHEANPARDWMEWSHQQLVNQYRG